MSEFLPPGASPASRAPVAIPRRTALGALLALVIAACSDSSTTPVHSAGSPPGSQPPSETGTPSATTSTVTPSASATYVRGSNQALTKAVLTGNARAYNGSWRGAFTESASGSSGTITGGLTIDPAARTFAARVSAISNLLPGTPLPPLTLTVNADSYMYDGDTGSFSVTVHTDLGTATVYADQGIGTGTFKLRLENIPGHTDVARIEASGIAFRPNKIPVAFTVVFTDGHRVSGQLAFTPHA